MSTSSATRRMDGDSPSCLPSTLGSSAGKEVGSESGHGHSFPATPLAVCVGLDREPSVCARVSPPSGAQGGAPGNGLVGGVSPISRCAIGTPDSPGQGELCRPATGESRPVAGSLSLSSGCACRWPPPCGASRPLALPQALCPLGGVSGDPAAPGQGAEWRWPCLSQETWTPAARRARARSRDPAPSCALPPPSFCGVCTRGTRDAPEAWTKVPQPCAAQLSPELPLGCPLCLPTPGPRLPASSPREACGGHAPWGCLPLCLASSQRPQLLGNWGQRLTQVAVDAGMKVETWGWVCVWRCWGDLRR